jgi:hypothetical protein
MAKLTGLTLIFSIISFIVWYFQGIESFFVAGVFFIVMMIPLGSFLSPYDESKKQKLTYFTAGIFLSGMVGIVLNSMPFLYIALFGIFIYQFIANSMAISSSSRRVEE